MTICITETKQYKKAKTTLTKEKLAEVLKQDKEALKSTIAYSKLFIVETTEKLHDNANYQRLKEDLKILEDGLKDTVKEHKALLELGTILLKKMEDDSRVPIHDNVTMTCTSDDKTVTFTSEDLKKLDKLTEQLTK